MLSVILLMLAILGYVVTRSDADERRTAGARTHDIPLFWWQESNPSSAAAGVGRAPAVASTAATPPAVDAVLAQSIDHSAGAGSAGTDETTAATTRETEKEVAIGSAAWNTGSGQPLDGGAGVSGYADGSPAATSWADEPVATVASSGTGLGSGGFGAVGPWGGVSGSGRPGGDGTPGTPGGDPGTNPPSTGGGNTPTPSTDGKTSESAKFSAGSGNGGGGSVPVVKDGGGSGSPSPAPTPEPMSLLLVGTGLAGLYKARKLIS